MLSRSQSLAVLASLLFINISPVGAQWQDFGCFSNNIGDVVHHNSTMTYNSFLDCYNICHPYNAAVMSLNYRDCWCGNAVPEPPTKTSPAACQQTCPGFPAEFCGNTVGDTLYSILLTGMGTPKGVVAGGSSSGSSSSSPTKSSGGSSPSYITKNSVVTQTVVSSGGTGSSGSSGSSGGSKAGIAAGVVVGLVALGAIIGGIYFFLRSRKRKAIERDHRRQSSINAFATAGATAAAAQSKAPYMSSMPMNDSRLDPILSARRQSDGSIADNVDFSRRVLKVTNPDDRW